MVITLLKFLRFFEGYEIPQAEDYYYLKKFIPIMNICIVPFWLIAPLGFAAFISTWKQKITSRFLLIFIVLYSLSIIPFFILGRFRLLIVPALLTGSGYTTLSLIENLRKRQLHLTNIIPLIVLFSFMILPALSEHRKADEASAYVNHGLYYMLNNNMQKAEAFFNKALAIMPNHVKALNNLASAYFFEGNFDDAIKTYNTSIDINTTQGLPHLNLGIIYLRSGDIGAAKNEIAKAVTLAPFSIRAQEYYQLLFNNNLSAYEVASIFLSKGKYREAIPFYEKALINNPDDMKIYNNYGYVLYSLGEYEKAIFIYEEGIKKFPSEIKLLNNLASVYLKIGEINKAKALWEKSLRLNPD